MERIVVKKLQAQIGGVRELRTNLGFIDLITKEEVIEVKKAFRFLEALRQVMCYAHEFPEKKKRIHLFGEKASYFQEKAKRVCERHNYDVRITIDA